MPFPPNVPPMAQATPPAQGYGGGTMPGVADLARLFAATGNAGQTTAQSGAMGSAAPGGLPSGPPQGGLQPGQAPWNPQTMIPPQMAQMGMNPLSGLLGQLYGLPPVGGTNLQQGTTQVPKQQQAAAPVKRRARTATEGSTPQANVPDQSRYTSKGPQPGLRWKSGETS